MCFETAQAAVHPSQHTQRKEARESARACIYDTYARRTRGFRLPELPHRRSEQQKSTYLRLQVGFIFYIPKFELNLKLEARTNEKRGKRRRTMLLQQKCILVHLTYAYARNGIPSWLVRARRLSMLRAGSAHRPHT